MPATPAANPRADFHPVGYSLATIAVLLVVAGLALAYGVDALARGQKAGPRLGDATQTVIRTLGERDLVIPLSWFRYREQGAEGFASQVDLTLVLPLGVDGADTVVEVSLVQRSRARSSASLLDGVYLHQFVEGQVEGPRGLVGKPLQASGGFANETVWYDALSASPFVAKCAAPVESKSPARCLRTVVLPSGIAAIYTFDAEVLASWRRFDTEIAPWLQRIGAL